MFEVYYKPALHNLQSAVYGTRGNNLLLLEYFDKLNARCPVCRAGDTAPLKVASREVEAAGHLIHGALHCTRPECMHEFPVIDGVPVVLPATREYVRDNLLAMVMRTDLPPGVESMLGDCAGPGSAFETSRQQQSVYGYGHYSDSDDRSVFSLLEVCASLAGELQGPVLEIGCGAGGVARRLAAQFDEPLAAIDLNFPLLQIAATAARTNAATFPLRRTGVVYDRRQIELPPQPAPPAFWLCDALSAPWDAGSFRTIVALNVLDSTPSPWQLLRSAATLLAPGGVLLLSCPYDWSASVTPFEQWVGGHSQRGPQQGDGPAVLRDLLRQWSQEEPELALHLIDERDNIPWRMRVHQRSTVEYHTHCMALRR